MEIVWDNLPGLVRGVWKFRPSWAGHGISLSDAIFIIAVFVILLERRYWLSSSLDRIFSGTWLFTKNVEAFVDATSQLGLSRCNSISVRGSLLNDGKGVRFCAPKLFSSVFAFWKNARILLRDKGSILKTVFYELLIDGCHVKEHLAFRSFYPYSQSDQIPLLHFHCLQRCDKYKSENRLLTKSIQMSVEDHANSLSSDNERKQSALAAR